MPLPTSTSIPLMGCSRPGEVAPSKPKQAMIVRMSAEAFDALQAFPNHPQMVFQFDEKSGIYIGDTFFPMRSMKEETLHELYLRSASAGKKPTSLKLHANVTGKFTVERAFSERLQGKIRETTINTVKQNERNIIVIDTPPDLTPTIHSRKRNQNPASTMFRSAVRPGDLPKPNPSASLPPPARVSSPMPPKPIKKDGSAPLRKRLVHCLAVCERTREQTVKMVGGAGCDSSVRREILSLLDDVAEQATVPKRGEDQAAQNWRLKPEAWLEVRPYEWPKLTELERTNMARTARQKLDSLRIPQTDAAWEYVKFRNLPGAAATSSVRASSLNLGPAAQGAPSREPKRGVTSKEAREKKARPKPDPKAEIRMKDESRAAPRSSVSEGKARDMGGAPASSKPIVRKTPGSGFRVGQSPSQDGRSDTAEASGSNNLPRSKPIDVRINKDRDPPSTSSMHPAPRPIQREGKSVTTAQPQRIKKMRESGGGGTDSERERILTSIKEKPRVKQRDDQDRRSVEEREGATLKRKKVTRDGDDYDAAVSRSAPQKKRKTENGAVHAVPASIPRTGEASLPPKPEVAPSSRPIPKKERSPLPMSPALPRIKKDNQPRPPPLEAKASPQESTSSSQARKANVAAKARRRSPIYTTSEDDSDPRRSTQNPKPLPTPPLTSEHTAPTTQSNPQSRPRTRESRPLPTDHAGLRNRYNSSYREYLTTFQKLVAQKGKLDSMLMSHEIGSVGSITDSDGDVELLDTEELMKLKSDHGRLKDELTTILEIFTPSALEI